MRRSLLLSGLMIGTAVACVLAPASLGSQKLASCAWASQSEVQAMVGVPVQAGKYSEEPPSNEAPYARATCVFAFKKQPHVPGEVDSVTFNYSNAHDSFLLVDGATGPEKSTESPAPGSSIATRTTAVPGLGVCPPDEATCPWTALLTVERFKGPVQGRQSTRFVNTMILGVRDSYIEYSIEINNPGGSLQVSSGHEITAIEQLARTIEPKFAALWVH